MSATWTLTKTIVLEKSRLKRMSTAQVSDNKDHIIGFEQPVISYKLSYKFPLVSFRHVGVYKF